MITRIAATALSVFLFAGPTIASAGEADVVKVEIRKEGARTYSFSVTLAHGDVGWKHYADGWEVVGPNNKVLGKRVLGHPHVHEQPFTRYLSGVAIAEGTGRVRLRAHDKVHGFGGREVEVDLPR